MAYLDWLEQSLASRLKQGDLGTPVWLRATLALSPDHGHLTATSAAALAMASRLLNSPAWSRLCSHGGPQHGHITTLIDFKNGNSAIITTETTTAEPSASLLILGNQGSLQFQDFPINPTLSPGAPSFSNAISQSLQSKDSVHA